MSKKWWQSSSSSWHKVLKTTNDLRADGALPQLSQYKKLKQGFVVNVIFYFRLRECKIFRIHELQWLHVYVSNFKCCKKLSAVLKGWKQCVMKCTVAWSTLSVRRFHPQFKAANFFPNSLLSSTGSTRSSNFWGYAIARMFIQQGDVDMMSRCHE